jgi:hypothetical protein
MEGKEELLTTFAWWIEEVRRLDRLPKPVWGQRVNEQWSVGDVVAHIWEWDVHFYEHAVHRVSLGESVTYRHLDYDAFNLASVEKGRKLSTERLVQETIQARERILEALRSIPEAMFDEKHPDGDRHPFTIRQYLKDFIWHDQHHIKQLRDVC